MTAILYTGFVFLFFGVFDCIDRQLRTTSPAHVLPLCAGWDPACTRQYCLSTFTLQATIPPCWHWRCSPQRRINHIILHKIQPLQRLMKVHAWQYIWITMVSSYRHPSCQLLTSCNGFHRTLSDYLVVKHMPNFRHALPMNLLRAEGATALVAIQEIRVPMFEVLFGLLQGQSRDCKLVGQMRVHLPSSSPNPSWNLPDATEKPEFSRPPSLVYTLKN